MLYIIFVVYENGTIKPYDNDFKFESAEEAYKTLKGWQELYHEDYLPTDGLYFTVLPTFR